MKRLIGLLYLLLLFMTTSAETKFAADWRQAAAAYNHRDYNTAARLYEDLWRSTPYSATACYNLGNTYYRMNRIPEAVLQYQRALFLNPDMKVARENCILAQQRIPNAIREIPDIFFVRWWNLISSGAKANFWAASALISFFGFLGLILLYRLRPDKIPVQAVAAVALLWICLMVPAYFSAENTRSTTLAVVMTHNAVLYTSPNSEKGRIPVPEATIVRMGERKGTWISVTLPDNRNGWIPLTDLGFVQQKK